MTLKEIRWYKRQLWLEQDEIDAATYQQMMIELVLAERRLKARLKTK